ncbi:MAG: hypothetical protein JXA92_11750 [candidate division Zixibacteria bacterium]|nr:hypothetical protein [candidate division Zixibacteria bacterium]
MSISKILLMTAGLVIVLSMATWADNSGRIYGKITTVDGDVLEGLIRWDKNEGSWVDILNGEKELSRKNLRDVEKRSPRKYSKRRSVKLFGIKIIDDDDGSFYSSWTNKAQSGVRFGHIKSMEFIDDDAVLLILKSGEEVELENYSTDIGTSIREIVIEDVKEGELELVWDDIEKIDFMPAGSSDMSVYGERLYGTLTTRRGDEFTGFICWDIDELFENDILDGNDNKRKRKIKFGKIQSIERYSSSGATVIMDDGEDMVLRGTNDVDNDNRGIVVSDPNLGDVEVEWDDFEKLEFKKAPKPVKYDEFDGGRLLKGTVYTEDGDAYKGTIRWDNDEEYTWEILDGNERDIEFNIEFGKIKEIKRKSYRGAEVTLWDGRMFYLRGSNDVDEDNKGVIVTLDNDDDVVVEWEELDRVEFSK